MGQQSFEYMLLNRLQSDCHTWLSGGGKLWGTDPITHAEKMVELWKILKIKPQWLELKELKNLYFKLTKTELTESDMT